MQYDIVLQNAVLIKSKQFCHIIGARENSLRLLYFYFLGKSNRGHLTPYGSSHNKCIFSGSIQYKNLKSRELFHLYNQKSRERFGLLQETRLIHKNGNKRGRMTPSGRSSVNPFCLLCSFSELTAFSYFCGVNFVKLPERENFHDVVSRS